MRRLWFGVAFALLASPLAASEVPDPIDCDNAMSTIEMNYCAELDYDRADKALNEVYQDALDVIQTSDNPEPYDAETWETAYRQAQRDWIAFRDAECRGLVPMEWSGGTGTTVAVLSCLTEMTESRTETLRERYLDR